MSSFERRPVYDIDDSCSMNLEHFYVPTHYADTLDSILIPKGMILDRVEKLGYDISKDYNGKTLHILCVLKGGAVFFNDLCNSIRRFHDYSSRSYVPFTFDFIRVKSYEGTESSGRVSIVGCDVSAFTGKDILIVEDIIDTGLTMTKLLDHINSSSSPASIRVASLLEKRTHRSCGYKADYVGFSIPDKFVVGYCLDYNEIYRDLMHIAVINKNGIEKFKEE